MALALPFFAVTLFVSAFLLFLVQPLIGKMILPKLGGTPQVWNTCMVFFQMALLFGYFYTHAVSTYLNVRKQIFLHCVLLVVPFLILLPNGPFNVIDWVPPAGGNPIFATLVLLTIIVGVPFFVVATSAPLLQKWFAYTGHPAAKDPYFLYGASNLGSMMSLVLYPIFFEPVFRLQAPVAAGAITFDVMSQTWIWTLGYGLLVLLVIGCALMALKGLPTSGLEAVSKHKALTPAAERDNPVGAEIATMPDPSTNPAVPPADVDHPAPTDEGSTAQEPAPAPAAEPEPEPAPVPAPAAASTNPRPGTAIKKGSKQGKKHDRGRSQKQPETFKPAPKRDAIQPAAATAAAPAGPSTAAPTITRAAPRGDEMTNGRRFRWVLLAAVPSSFMLAVTTHISTDISAIPLFWVIPLALYLLTFILVFMKWPFNWIEQAHTAMLYVHPAALAAVVFVSAPLAFPVAEVKIPTVFNLIGFFVTTLVCHGELAKDRPSTRHLTEFYLWMSVGGMLGGMFNGLIAPVIFTGGIWEFPIAIITAAAIRPVLTSRFSLDRLIAGLLSEQPAKQEPQKGKKPHRPAQRAGAAEPTANLSYTLDVVLALVVGGLTLLLTPMGYADTIPLRAAYLIPLLIAATFVGRPLRLALALLFFIVITTARERGGSEVLAAERSYFGVLRIQQSATNGRRGENALTADGKEVQLLYNSMTHGTTHHGQNFLPKPKNALDYSRLATTYYHRRGPAGVAMAKFDHFDPNGDYYYRVDEKDKVPYPSDFRMPANIFGALTGDLLAGSPLPASAITAAWSEPPYAVIGLGTGTMASYARPYQHVHFYEIDDRVRRYSLPDDPKKEPFFTYLRDARARGAAVHVLMGDARLRMAQDWHPPQDKDKQPWEIDMKDRGGPKGYYHLIVVDAFSSDAIPVHLLTKEAVEMYMSRLAPGGVLCVHISNRHLKLDDVVGDIARAIEVERIDPKTGKMGKFPLAAQRGRDNISLSELTKVASRRMFTGHSTSEWVMLARDPEDLKHLRAPEGYGDQIREMNDNPRRRGYAPSDTNYWLPPPSTGRFVWTDDYSNLLGVLRW